MPHKSFSDKKFLPVRAVLFGATPSQGPAPPCLARLLPQFPYIYAIVSQFYSVAGRRVSIVVNVSQDREDCIELKPELGSFGI